MDFVEERFKNELERFEDLHHHSVEEIISHLESETQQQQQQQQYGRQRRGASDCFVSVEDRLRYCRSLQLTAADSHWTRHGVGFRHSSATAVRLVLSRFSHGRIQTGDTGSTCPLQTNNQWPAEVVGSGRFC